MRARGYTRVLNMTHVFAGVCLWKKPGRVRVRQSYFFYVLNFISNVASTAHVSKIFFSFHLYVLYVDEQ